MTSNLFPSTENAAAIVKSELAQLGITVNIQILTNEDCFSDYSSYTAQVANTATLPQMAFLGCGGGFLPLTLSPADAWGFYVSNGSVFGNWAGYANPTVQACVNAFLTQTNTATVQSLCTAAQAQVQNDAPYFWIGVPEFPNFDSTMVWKTGVITGFEYEPIVDGTTDLPLLNTITLG